jgi:hypothetical protein
MSAADCEICDPEWTGEFEVSVDGVDAKTAGEGSR